MKQIKELATYTECHVCVAKKSQSILPQWTSTLQCKDQPDTLNYTSLLTSSILRYCTKRGMIHAMLGTVNRPVIKKQNALKKKLKQNAMLEGGASKERIINVTSKCLLFFSQVTLFIQWQPLR